MRDAEPHKMNPYAPPLTVGAEHVAESLPFDPALAQQRRLVEEEKLKENTFCLICIFFLFSIVANISIFGPVDEKSTVLIIVVAMVSTPAALAGLVVNWGVRSMASWSRRPLTVLALVGLLLVPLGTLFGGLILLALFAGRVPRLLSQEYEEIVQATTQIKKRTSRMFWVAVALLMLLAAAVAVISQLPPEFRHAPANVQNTLQTRHGVCELVSQFQTGSSPGGTQRKPRNTDDQPQAGKIRAAV